MGVAGRRSSEPCAEGCTWPRLGCMSLRGRDSQSRKLQSWMRPSYHMPCTPQLRHITSCSFTVNRRPDGCVMPVDCYRPMGRVLAQVGSAKIKLQRLH